MFYLKELFLIGRDHKALTLVNLTLLSLFLTSLQYRGEIRQFFSMEQRTSSHPYFNALVSSATGVNSDYIARKMGNLPGVAKVELKDSTRLRSDLKGFLKELGGEASLLSQDYKAYKINLDKNIQPKSRKLIQEYFSRLVGKQEVTFSQVKSPALAQAPKKGWRAAFSRFADTYLPAMAATGWLFTLWLLSNPIGAQTFVIERFQRKENTAVKIYACLCATGSAAALIAGRFGNGIQISDLLPAFILMGAGSMFFLKKKKSPKRFI